VDVYPTIEAYERVFRDVVKKMNNGTTVIVNSDDQRAMEIGRSARDQGKHLVTVGMNGAGVRIGRIEQRDGGSSTGIRLAGEREAVLNLHGPGEMNVRNAMMALAGALAVDPGIDRERASDALSAFTGCWRRFERIGEIHGAIAISDYGHHPTEVRATLAAAHEAFPGRRIVLVFQPHHRNRTKNLFDEFVTSFDGADVLLLVEIYDVPGREMTEDAQVSSSQLMEAVKQRDADAGKSRPISFVPSVGDLSSAIDSAGITEKDVVIFMGAGAIDAVARKIISSSDDASSNG
jgi:UDP-N-acetylmuramate--alanine ligase